MIDGRVYYVDLLAGRVLAADPQPHTVPQEVASLAKPVGAVAPTDGGGLVAAVDQGAAILHNGAVTQWLGSPAANGPVALRINDAAVDPSGRLWVGAMAWDNTEGAGALYRFDPDGQITTAITDLTIPNGPAFSRDGCTMYLADTAKSAIYAFALDPETGRLSDRRTFAEVDGSPDGMTVDSGDCLWVAIWGGGRLHRYSDDGWLRESIPLPARQPTSVALSSEPPFVAVVTTATYGLEPADEDGRTLVAPVGVGGLRTAAFSRWPRR